MAAYIDNAGKTQQLSIDTGIYRMAADRNLSVRQMINQDHPVQAGALPAWDQLCASEGMFLGSNNDFGIAPPTMDAILNGSTKIVAGSVVKEATPASRILFPIFQLSALENKLRDSDYGMIGLFNGAAAVVQTINSEKFERPILNFTQPEGARAKAIAQNSEPTSMLSITASDKSWRITGKSLGMEISDQAMRIASLDLVTLAMQRQAEVQLQEDVEAAMLAFLNGDTDMDQAALTAVTAASLDAAATSGLTQDAWVSWLISRKRRINYVITDMAGARAIEKRTGRPDVTGDNPTSKRIDVLEDVVNPLWPERIKVFITLDPNWPAKTLLGFDSRYGYHVVNSSVLNYEASEAYAMRRSTKFRIDTGMISYRLFDSAWAALTYA
jgi:hypothetical protein